MKTAPVTRKDTAHAAGMWWALSVAYVMGVVSGDSSGLAAISFVAGALFFAVVLSLVWLQKTVRAARQAEAEA